jgi:hypothetical protein
MSNRCRGRYTLGLASMKYFSTLAAELAAKRISGSAGWTDLLQPRSAVVAEFRSRGMFRLAFRAAHKLQKNYSLKSLS